MDDSSGMFDAAPAMAADLAAAPGRGTRRDSMFLTASIRSADGAEGALRVRNISAGGMMAECAIAFEPGRAVEVNLRGIGLVRARIAWARKGRIGLAFDTNVDPQLVRRAEPRLPGAGVDLVRAAPQRSQRPPLKTK